MRKLAKNVGVVGYGYWGTNLARVFRELPGAPLYAVVELDAQKRELARQRYPGVKIAERLEDVLEDPALDAVAIATQVDMHFELAMAALQAGKHVWLEKPMTETSSRGPTARGGSRKTETYASRRPYIHLLRRRQKDD